MAKKLNREIISFGHFQSRLCDLPIDEEHRVENNNSTQSSPLIHIVELVGKGKVHERADMGDGDKVA